MCSGGGISFCLKNLPLWEFYVIKYARDILLDLRIRLAQVRAFGDWWGGYCVWDTIRCADLGLAQIVRVVVCLFLRHGLLGMV